MRSARRIEATLGIVPLGMPPFKSHQTSMRIGADQMAGENLFWPVLLIEINPLTRGEP